MSILSNILKKKQKKRQNDNFRQMQDPGKPDELPIHRDYKDNIARIKEEYGNSTDISYREFKFCGSRGIAVYIDGLASNTLISDFFMETVTEEVREMVTDSFQQMIDFTAGLGNVESITNWNEVHDAILVGNTVFFLDGFQKALSVETKGWEKRAISEPSTQLSIQGPKDSFTETLRTNTAQIRRRIKSPNLWIESMKLGTVTQTDIAIMYIKGIANEKIIGEVKERLNRINIDGVQASGFLEQLFEDQTWTPFPTTHHSERPDVITSHLLEGRIALVVDGTPFVVTVPALFIQFFQAPDDYYARFDISTSIRLLRILAFFIALIGPAAYIAGTTFHQEMIPTTMAIAIAAQRENVPFPAFFEALIMEVTFEILREAGLRLPRAVGQAVSIVGALVIGQAAVQAGFVSPVMVIVVSITAIANFSTPVFTMAIAARLIRFIMMGLATILGFYGIMLGIMFMTIHLCSLRSFGVPYMMPIAPFNIRNQQDVFIRFPIWAMKNRPMFISKGNVVRTGENQKPGPPKQDEDQSSQGDS
ncbi:spore germination protein [Paenibacillus sp. BSR1-1]|uniref:spore germination protein n=1 Tax=Paenibacillus sp. BSR1-1 TaxID=3020845 RepID=UPI0025AF916B|nr:spore germination protein [Paenibacillus sp. BSR1-1]MDN3015280.1 spore germination protein [Paenibacillus sp. BSR1-1]